MRGDRERHQEAERPVSRAGYLAGRLSSWKARRLADDEREKAKMQDGSQTRQPTTTTVQATNRGHNPGNCHQLLCVRSAPVSQTAFYLYHAGFIQA